MATKPHSPPPSPSRERRRANTSSEEEAYAGPAVLSPLLVSETPLSPATTVASTLKRLRRTWGVLDEVLPVVKDDIEVDLRRVGAPTLCRLPATYQVLSMLDERRIEYERDLKPVIWEILTGHAVSVEVTFFCRRAWRFDRRDPSEWPLTILIFAGPPPADDRTPWQRACTEIARLLESRGMHDLAIEIADDTTNRWTQSFAVPADHPIVPVWPDVAQKLLSVLAPTDCSEFVALRRGLDPVASNNPVTVFVTIPEDSTHDWVTVRDEIVRILDGMRLQAVAVEISVGGSWPALAEGPTLLDDSIFQVPATVGGSIGRHPAGNNSSTLGGFLSLKFRDGSSKVVGVTCHHALVPPVPDEDLRVDERVLRAWNRDGYPPSPPATNPAILVSQPSLMDYGSYLLDKTTQLAEREGVISRLESKREEQGGFLMPTEGGQLQLSTNLVRQYRRDIDHARIFVDAGSDMLGRLWASSGLRQTIDQHTLDWALIEVEPRRLSANRVPDATSMPSRDRAHYHPLTDIVSLMMTANEPEPGAMLFKAGRTTGTTCGAYSGVEAYTFVDEVYRDELGQPRRLHLKNHVVVNRTTAQGSIADRGDSGDSGAFILDEAAVLVGMLVAGSKGGGYMRFTVIKDLVEDIRRATGAVEVTLPEN